MIARRRRNNSGSESKQVTNGFVQHSGNTFVTSNPTVPSTKSVVVEPEMSCRDRTGEFLSACKVLQTRQVYIFQNEYDKRKYSLLCINGKVIKENKNELYCLKKGNFIIKTRHIKYMYLSKR